MKNSFIFSIVAVAGSMLISGCAATTNPYIAAKQLADIPETNHLAKLLSSDDADRYFGFNWICSAVSLGKGLFLTSAGCTERSHWVLGLDGKRHKAIIVKQGHDYATGENTISDTDENWAILYAEDFALPAVEIAETDMHSGEHFCTAYYTQDKAWGKAQQITPLKACGVIRHANGLHRIIVWRDLKEQRGFWGSPVFDEKGKLAGIISYKITGDFKKAGILPVSVFRDAIKETRL